MGYMPCNPFEMLLHLPYTHLRTLFHTALSGGAGARTKDKWGIFKSIDDVRPEPLPEAEASWTGHGNCAGGHETLQDEIALLKGKLASARSLAAEAERKLEESRKQAAQLQQQRHSLLQERKAAQAEAAQMKLELREARQALSISHRASKDVMMDYLRALREAEARVIPPAPSSPLSAASPPASPPTFIAQQQTDDGYEEDDNFDAIGTRKVYSTPHSQ